MGFNSVLFVCNDALDTIKRDPDGFADEIVRRMGSLGTGEFGFGSHANGFDIPHIGHADEVALIAVGGNYATKLVSYHAGWHANHQKEEGQVALLKALAEKLGYTLRKKPKKTG